MVAGVMWTVWKASEVPPGPRRADFQPSPGGSHRLRVQAHQQESAVGHLSGQLDHPGPGRGHEDGRRGLTDVSQAGLHPVEFHPLATKQTPNVQDGTAHRFQ